MFSGLYRVTLGVKMEKPLQEQRELFSLKIIVSLHLKMSLYLMLEFICVLFLRVQQNLARLQI